MDFYLHNTTAAERELRVGLTRISSQLPVSRPIFSLTRELTLRGFWFLVCYSTTQLENQLQQTRIQVVRPLLSFFFGVVSTQLAFRVQPKPLGVEFLLKTDSGYPRDAEFNFPTDPQKIVYLYTPGERTSSFYRVNQQVRGLLFAQHGFGENSLARLDTCQVRRLGGNLAGCGIPLPLQEIFHVSTNINDVLPKCLDILSKCQALALSETV